MSETNNKPKVNICWLRRDLRLDDNAALYHALKAENPVLIVFIFDKNILDKLGNKSDARVDFIHQQLLKINDELVKKGSSLLVKYNTPENAWQQIITQFKVNAVYTNHDYEPYARKRDKTIGELLKQNGIAFHTFKDQVIFEKSEVQKADGTPYTVFTPYYKQWQLKLNEFYLRSYPTTKYLKNLYKVEKFKFPLLQDIGFAPSDANFPSTNFAGKLDGYEKDRDFPAKNATTHLGLHLRFGTVSIRKVAREALAQKADKWVSELAWREFYMMILWHFPHTTHKAFKADYDRIRWRNNEKEFELWCKAKLVIL